MKLPSAKQEKFANDIAKTLHIDLAHTVTYTACAYFHFIQDNLDKFNEYCRSEPASDWWDWEYAIPESDCF